MGQWAIPFILLLPAASAVAVHLVTRRWRLAWLLSAAVLPIMLLIDVVVWPPDRRTEWQITLVLAIIWGTITGGAGASMSRLLKKDSPLNSRDVD